jgi:hypothetical protein
MTWMKLPKTIKFEPKAQAAALKVQEATLGKAYKANIKDFTK